METKKKSSIANILIQVAKNLSDINDKLGKIEEAYLQEKSELSRNIGGLWNSFNEYKRDFTILKEDLKKTNEDLSKVKRTLFGEHETDLKGIIEKVQDINNNLNTLSQTVEGQINNLANTLKSLVEETKENNIKRDTTIKILTTMCTILTSGGFLTFVAFIYKIIAK